MSLTDSPTVSFNDLMAIVAAYFDINTSSEEREAETAAPYISRSFLRIKPNRCYFIRFFWIVY